MRQRSAIVLLLLLLAAAVPGADLHPEDHRACPTCQAALARSMEYLRKNFDQEVAGNGWYSGMLSSFWGGFAFLIDGNSPKEAKVCAERMRFYLEIWARKGMGYDGWFASMAMLYISEYCLRYGTTPELAAALEFGAKFAHKTREAEGGWFHNPRWGGPNYAIDISGVGCGYFAAVRNMGRLRLDAGPALADVDDYLGKVCDGRSVAYGLNGRGGFALASAGYVLIGLTSSGAGDDPRVSGIGGNLLDNVEKIRSAHASGNLHHFAVAAALHRSGPAAYARFAGFYLHRLLIPNQAGDGSVAAFPNDNTKPAEEAYAELKKGGDYGATAILASMIMMTRQGAFSPFPPRKSGLPPNQECFAKAQGLLAAGRLAGAHEQLSNVLPGGGDDQLIPLAQKQRKALEDLLNERLRALREGMAAADPAERAAAEPLALAIQGGVVLAAALEKLAAGLPQAAEAKTLAADARKRLVRLRGKFGPALGKPGEGEAGAPAPPTEASPFAGDAELAAGMERVLALGRDGIPLAGKDGAR
jgi:hypothetical protein